MAERSDEPTYFYMGAQQYAAWQGTSTDREHLQAEIASILAAEGITGQVEVMTPYDEPAFSVEMSPPPLVIEASETDMGTNWETQLRELDARLHALDAREESQILTQGEGMGYG